MPECQLTARQQDVLAILSEYSDAGLPCPTQEEIAQRLGISQQAVAVHLTALERLGRIVRVPGAHRSLTLLGKVQRNGA